MAMESLYKSLACFRSLSLYNVLVTFIQFVYISYFVHGASNVSHDETSTTATIDTTLIHPTGNSTNRSSFGNLQDAFESNKGLVMRSFYVLLAVTAIIVVYMGVRWWRIKCRSSRVRRYGLISSGKKDKMEMKPLEGDQDDEDDDVTLYEQNGRLNHQR